MYPEKLKEIDFSILNIIHLNPGISPTELGVKSHISRYTALSHSAKLEKLGYVQRKKNGGNVFKIELSPEIKIENINEIKYNQDRKMLNDVMNEQLDLSRQAWKYRLSTCPEKPLETLILLAKLQRDVSVQELIEASQEYTSASNFNSQLKKLLELELAQRKNPNGGCRYVYSLNPLLTLQIIQEALDIDISDFSTVVSTNSVNNEITSEDTPLSSQEVAKLLAKGRSIEDVDRVSKLIDNNNESLKVNTTEQAANGYNHNETSVSVASVEENLQPLVSMDSPASNVLDLDTAYDIEDEIELLYGVIKTQQSEIESLQQRMVKIEELMGQSNQKRDLDRAAQLQAQDKIDRRNQRMQSMKSFAPASISLPSERMINSNGKG